MITYLLVLFATTIPLYYVETKLDSKQSQKWTQIILFSTLVIFVLLAGFRSIHVGNDLGNYRDYYMSDFYYNIERGYVGLSRLFHSIGLPFRAYMFIVEFIVAAPILFVIYRQSQKKWLSLFLYQSLYLFANSFNIYRQSLAMSMIVLALYFLFSDMNDKKRIGLFTLFVVIASLFHISAIIFLPLLLLKHIKLNLKWIIAIIAFSGLVFFFRNELITTLMRLFSREYYGELTVEFGLSTVALLGILFTIVIFNLSRNAGYLNETMNRFVFNILFFALLFNVLWIWFPNHARITMYIYLIIAIYYPNTLDSVKNTKIRAIEIFTIVFITFGLYFYQLKFRDYGGVVPYQIEDKSENYVFGEEAHSTHEHFIY